MSAKTAYGNFVLKRGVTGASPAAHTAIAGIRSVNGVKSELAFNDSTTFDDTGGFRTYAAGLKDPGTLDLEIYFDPNAASYTALTTQHDAGTLASFRVELLTGSLKVVREFEAYVASVGESFEVDGFFQASISLRISGAIDRDAV